MMKTLATLVAVIVIAATLTTWGNQPSPWSGMDSETRTNVRNFQEQVHTAQNGTLVSFNGQTHVMEWDDSHHVMLTGGPGTDRKPVRVNVDRPVQILDAYGRCTDLSIIRKGDDGWEENCNWFYLQ